MTDDVVTASEVTIDLVTPFGPLASVVATIRAIGTDLTRIEVKSAADGFGPRSLAPTVSAFANTEGGIIILGLDERRQFRPTESFDARRVAKQAEEQLRPHSRPKDLGRPLVEPMPACQIDIAQVDGAAVVVITVEELPAKQKPCFITTRGKETGSFLRLADGDHPMSTYQVFQMSTLTTQPTDDQAPVPGATLSDLDSLLVDRYLSRLRATDSQIFKVSADTPDALTRLRVLADGQTPTLAGLMALGAYPQQFFPQLVVAVSVFPGASRGEIVDDVRLLDRRNCDGSIPVMVEKAINAVSQNLRRRREMRGADAVDVLEIPIAVLREAIVNALLHRDYSPLALGQQVMVDVFPDRVEITSPGGLWGGQRIADITQGVSRSRNSVLSRLLEEVPRVDSDRAVCENRGTGIPVMVSQMRSTGHSVPRFTDQIDRFVVQLDRHGLLTPEFEAWLESVGADQLDRTGKLALAILRSGRGLNRNQLHLQLGLDPADAERKLGELVSAGWLEFPTRIDGGFREGPRLKDAQPRLWPPGPGELATHPTSARDRVLACFGDNEQLTARQIADSAGLRLGTVRGQLAALVKLGVLIPTAPPTSRHRAYRRAEPATRQSTADSTAPAHSPTAPTAHTGE